MTPIVCVQFVLQDEDEDDAQGAAASQDIWMTRAAQLGRAAPVATFARLTELLGSLHHALAEAASSGAERRTGAAVLAAAYGGALPGR